jgi:hypothetical protein
VSSARLPAGRPALRAASCGNGRPTYWPQGRHSTAHSTACCMQAFSSKSQSNSARSHVQMQSDEVWAYLQLLGVQFRVDGRQSVL